MFREARIRPIRGHCGAIGNWLHHPCTRLPVQATSTPFPWDPTEACLPPQKAPSATLDPEGLAVTGRHRRASQPLASQRAPALRTARAQVPR